MVGPNKAWTHGVRMCEAVGGEGAVALVMVVVVAGVVVVVRAVD